MLDEDLVHSMFCLPRQVLSNYFQKEGCFHDEGYMHQLQTDFLVNSTVLST